MLCQSTNTQFTHQNMFITDMVEDMEVATAVMEEAMVDTMKSKLNNTAVVVMVNIIKMFVSEIVN